jgi:Autotransporter beta-domain
VRDDLNSGDFLFQPDARAGYRYDFANGQEDVKANFVDVTPINQFEISGPKPAHGNAVAGGGLAISTGAWSIGLGFDYLYASSGNTSEEGTITLLGRI